MTTIRRSRSQRGAAFVEAAFALLFLFFVLMGTFEFGRAVWTYNTVAYASRMAARYAQVHGTVYPASDDDIEAVVDENIIGLDPSRATVATSWSPDRRPGSRVTVQVTYPHQFALFLPGVSSRTLTVESSSSAVISY